MSDDQSMGTPTKGSQNWMRQDRLDAIWWGLVLILGALVLLADLSGWTERWSWWNGWGVIFASAGVLSLVGAVVRVLVPIYRAKWIASLVFGALFLAIGLGAWNVADWVWVVVMLILGIVTLVSALSQR